MIIPTKDIVCYEVDNDEELLILCPMGLDSCLSDYEVFSIKPLTRDDLVERYGSGNTICCDHLGFMIEEI